VGRRARALTVIHLTKQALAMLNMEDRTTWVLGFIPVNLARLRDLLLGVLTRFQWVRSLNAWRLSGLGAR